MPVVRLTVLGLPVFKDLPVYNNTVVRFISNLQRHSTYVEWSVIKDSFVNPMETAKSVATVSAEHKIMKFVWLVKCQNFNWSIYR